MLLLSTFGDCGTERRDRERLYSSGTWRQQFDWAVVEWNRDNVFEHPALRYLPDGNLSGLTLSYIEQRTNCLPVNRTFIPPWSGRTCGCGRKRRIAISTFIMSA